MPKAPGYAATTRQIDHEKRKALATEHARVPVNRCTGARRDVSAETRMDRALSVSSAPGAKNCCLEPSNLETTPIFRPPPPGGARGGGGRAGAGAGAPGAPGGG